MSEHVYFISLGLVLGTVLLIFGMRSFAAVVQARARLADEQAYRKLSEVAAADQSAVASSLARIEAALSQLSPRIASVEKILKEVG